MQNWLCKDLDIVNPLFLQGNLETEYLGNHGVMSEKKKKKRLGLREMERRRDFLLYCCWVSDYNSQDQSGIKITPKIGRGKKDVKGRKWTLWECLGRQFLRIPDPVLIQVQAELDTSALPQFRYYHHLLKAAWLGKWWLFKPSLSSLIFSNCLLHVSSM